MSFIEHRDHVFMLCTPIEQSCLINLASWYGLSRQKIFSKPNIFTESFYAVLLYRLYPWANQKPPAIVRALAKISGLIFEAERLIGQRSQRNFIAYLRLLVDRNDADVMLGVVHFLRALPLEIGFDGQRKLEQDLDAIREKCVLNGKVSALRRFDAVQRCILRSAHANDSAARDSANGLRKYVWQLLLEVAEEDIDAAVRLVDEQLTQRQTATIFTTLDLHAAPELAYRLAVKFKPSRVEFAVTMLQTSIFDLSWQLKKLEGPPSAALEKVMDASCSLLAAWTFETSAMDSRSVLLSIDRLFQFGKPEDSYWSGLSHKCVNTIQGLNGAEQDNQLGLLAQIIFYGDKNSELVDEARELFSACISRRIGRPEDSPFGLESGISDVCRSVSILEDKFLSLRNRHISANPDHFLLKIVEGHIQDAFDRLLTSEPSAALQHMVSLTLELSNETLIRKHHRILRDEFSVRARSFPNDAGHALKKLIQYCGYSQLDDEMYRKEICQESFTMLLPILDGLSPADAAVARTGIGWTPRSGYI